MEYSSACGAGRNQTPAQHRSTTPPRRRRAEGEFRTAAPKIPTECPTRSASRLDERTNMSMKAARSTTTLSVRRDGQVALGGDGQVTLGATVAKHDAVKIRRIGPGGKVLTGFAGSAADAFALLERFEKKLGEHPDNTRRAVIELAKDWRTDRILRRLEAMLAVADASTSLIVSGAGDVIEPTDGVIGIGSGGPYALSAAKALLHHSSLDARAIVEASLRISGEVCIYSNTNIRVETL